ncbi:type III restriction-modification system StyLTI enzyme res [Mycobacteroides abscessus subsp. bolletii]|uniref:restriction endonuclease n=1 Tax=Mycobacteroides abscessus TaxID=36809 RepID=UPI0009C4B6AD|nr:restriction endonuclease [Mycobacteroides abscessus]SKX68654.1 type III restriction-modification system StyLTI enzyme res [Mycobacteroides abscessus subsp. bolletii]
MFRARPSNLVADKPVIATERLTGEQYVQASLLTAQQSPVVYGADDLAVAWELALKATSAPLDCSVHVHEIDGMTVHEFTRHDTDSHVERDFAGRLENDYDHVKLFTKLPRRFKVRTPVGEYSPDWAIFYDDNGTEHLYLVQETKGSTNLDDLQWDEAMRIRFARSHFAPPPQDPCNTTSPPPKPVYASRLPSLHTITSHCVSSYLL